MRSIDSQYDKEVRQLLVDIMLVILGVLLLGVVFNLILIIKDNRRLRDFIRRHY